MWPNIPYMDTMGMGYTSSNGPSALQIVDRRYRMLPSRLGADSLGRIGFNMPGVYENNGMCEYDVTSSHRIFPVPKMEVLTYISCM